MNIKNVIDLFRKGGRVRNPENWKNVQAMSETLFPIIAAIIGILRFFNVDFHITDEQIMLVAVIVASIGGAISAAITLISSKKVGIPGLKPIEETNKEVPNFGGVTPDTIKENLKKNLETVNADFDKKDFEKLGVGD